MKEFLPKLQILTSFILLLIMVVVSYWLVRPYEPVIYNENPFPIITPIVEAGNNVLYHSDTCRTVTGKVLVSRTLRNDVLINLPDRTFTQEKAECVSFNNASVEIPTFAPSGIYTIEITSCFQVNPIREVCSKVLTEEFEVIN